MSSTVVCTAAHPVDLDDGRSLPPGESADNVDITVPANATLINAGQIVVTSGDKPKPHPPAKRAEAPQDKEVDN